MYDVIIIGAGPAGLTAGIYAGRMKLKTAIIDKMLPGGQILLTENIENFPGFPDGISSQGLVDRLISQVKELNVEIVNAEVKEIKKKSNFIVKTSEAKEIESKTVIIVTGSQYKKLEIPGEEKLIGKGISFCAICDAPLFKNKEVVVIGGGNQAVEEALTLERHASKVTLMHRRDKLRAVKLLEEKLLKNKKIEVAWNTIPLSFQGENKLESIKIKNLKSQEEDMIKVQGAFISVGMKPNTDFLQGLLKLDENGYIVTDDEMVTSIEGIFAGGDCRKKSLRQVITACSEGAICAHSAFRYLDNM
ncbi:MAG: thioredoxin-disulfide reductase [Candidatus Omnitrophota bacterium]